MLLILFASVLCVVSVEGNAYKAKPDMKLAYNALLACYSNYCGSGADRKMDCYWCKKIPDVKDGTQTFLSRFGDDETGPSGMVTYNRKKKYAMVVWQGASNIDGAVADGMIGQMQFPGAPTGVKIHTGFYKAATRARKQVADLAAKALKKCGRGCKLVVTGHSLGASLVYPSTVHLIEDIGKLGHPIHTYTYGAARVFNPQGAIWWNSVLMKKSLGASFRFVQGRDVVTKVPREKTLNMRFMHCAREVWFKDEKTMVMSSNDLLREDARGAASHGGVNFTDHNYYFGHFLNDGMEHRCLYSSIDNPLALGVFKDADGDGKTERAGWQNWLNNLSRSALEMFKKWGKKETPKEKEESKRAKILEMAKHMRRKSKSARPSLAPRSA